ncbi:MAG: T9SS type A sorting domain-containing protein [Bacteroidota bacterium]
MAECDRRRLFKTTNGGVNYNWTDITPTSAEFSLHNVGVFDIAVHPTNPNLIYIALDRNVAGKRVFRCNDGVWTNISDGLPNVPVNCIKYYKRENNLNELIVGTDLGVYYRNDLINKWVPFGTDLPLISVSDLEINYTTKELVAATFGRGIYKANLCFDPNEINPIYVEYNQTWDNKLLSNDVIVKQGVVLTITGTVEMPPAKHIYIQKGGLLILDGGKITNACKGEQWGGIIIFGSPTGPQTLNYQGMVEIKNYGTIENAQIGIHCKSASNEEGGSVGTSNLTGGGIVIVDKAWFKNNSISVVFQRYTPSSASKFKSCTFVINDELFPDATFKYFVRMNEVNGITFTGCTFTNEHNSILLDRSKGIFSNNSFFMVDQLDLPPFPSKKSLFIDLHYGIYAIGKKGGRTFSIRNTEFKNNESGIYASAVDLMSVKNNKVFMKGKNPSPIKPEVASGIYLDKCSGYIIEENELRTTEVAEYFTTYGIYINNSGEANNTIYKNKFYDNTYGITAHDKNRNKDGSAGLRLKCNEFNNVKMDIAVLKTEPEALLMGIAGSQGSNGTTCDTPAGNLFSNLAPSTGYYSIHNSGEFVDYFHHNPISEQRVRPSFITENTVTRQPTQWIYTINCCPPNSTGGGRTSTIDGEIASYKTESLNTSGTLITLIDEGETVDKVLEVNLASPSEALLVRNSLLQYSPFVSDTVLKSSINREELLNNAMIRDVMVANPHSAKSETLMQELDMRLEPMPDYMKDEILEGVFVLSAKELMEAKRDMEMHFYNYGFNRLLSASLTDTIPVPSDTLIALLNADGSARSLMQQAWILFEAGDTISALNRMETIPTGITLNEQELAELTEQHMLMQWLSEAPVLDSINLETLSNFVESSSSNVSAAARSILIANNLLEYNEPYLVPDLTKSADISKPKPGSVRNQTQMIRVFPNPGKDYVTIEYNLGDNYPSGSYEVADQSGRTVKRGNLGRKTDQVVLDTFDLTPGNYYISLISASTNIASARFVISK